MVALSKYPQSRYEHVPDELKNQKQWARYIKIDEGTDKERDKVPARLNERVMKWGTQSNWLTFEQVETFDKIGNFITPESGIFFVDYDGCIDENGIIHPLVLSWIKNTYAEISPNKRGIKAWFKGSLPDNKAVTSKDVPWADNDPHGHIGIEMYGQKHFSTVTGNIVPGCPSEINEASEALNDMLIRFSPAPKAKKKPPPEAKKTKDIPATPGLAYSNWNFDDWVHRHLDIKEKLADGYIIACPWAHLHTTPGDVARIWEGPPHTFNCFHAHCNGREWSDVRLLIEPDAYEWKNSRSIEQSIKHLPIYPEITMEEQEEQITQAAITIEPTIREHMEAKDGTALIISFPQGTGKTHVTAEFVAKEQENIITAWMSPTKEVAYSVPALHKIYHIQACSKHNCDKHAYHHAIGGKGYNTQRSLHKYHECEWQEQPFEGETVVFNQQYYKSSYPASHDLVINDEATLSDWLEERKITIPQLQKVASWKTPDSEDDKFLRAVQATMTDLAQSKPVHGKPIVDRLDRDGQFMNWMGILIEKYANTRPETIINLNNDEFDELTHIHNKPDVILPHIVKALADELVKWQSGKEWNSRISIRRDSSGEVALYIVEPRQLIIDKDGNFPPFVHLDGSFDEEIHSRLFGREIKVLRATINPAPGTYHAAIRDNNFYGKTAHTAEHKDGSQNKTLAATIKKAKYMLAKFNPDGSKKIALISHMDCVDEIAEALGIPQEQTGYYWNIRGSNSLEKCNILFLIGTPILPPQKVATIARSLYFDDSEVINEEWTRENGYADSRLKHLAQFLTNSELTQAAHRVRPIRHANKIIVSFCEGTIDYLPITETFTSLPYMTEEGENLHTTNKEASFEKLRIAYEELSKDGNKVKLADLANKSGVRKQTASQWMKDNASQDVPNVKTQSTEENGGSRRSIINDYIDLREPGSFSPEKETKLIFDPTDLQQYRGIEKGARVDTPIGQGEVCRIGIRDALGVRVAVYVDGCTTGLQSFAWNEVHPIVEPAKTSEKVNAALDALFA